jgi:hypothetical protein
MMPNETVSVEGRPRHKATGNEGDDDFVFPNKLRRGKRFALSRGGNVYL